MHSCYKVRVMKQSITDLMKASGVGFGTSGARGLVASMTSELCHAYTMGFLQYLHEQGAIQPGARVAVGGDLRPSSDRIMRAVMQGIEDRGYEPINCGKVPSPALALYGFRRGIASIMVTGSHIPDDRNGIKFNAPHRELLKSDEPPMLRQQVRVATKLPDWRPPAVDETARNEYVNRYIKAFGDGFLRGKRIGVYGHSSVSRDLMQRIYEALGAEVIRLGDSDVFVPVDTEAIREQDVALGRKWAAQCGVYALVSTDGDGDRPLISDEIGRWLRGDMVGIITAKRLGAQVVAVPVSCNTAVELCGAFDRVIRTRIGSPYVVEAMMSAGDAKVVGYEANGGFLTSCELQGPRGPIGALATRDALIVQLSVLWAALDKGCTISALEADLPKRYTWSDRIKQVPTEVAVRQLDRLKDGGARAMEGEFGGACNVSTVNAVDWTDGLRMYFDGGAIVHVRPSGNAPELRCYTEADTLDRAKELGQGAMKVLREWRTSQ